MLTLELARQAQALARGSLPESVLDAAKVRVLDVLGCALGGLSLHPDNLMVKVASRMGGKPEATLLGGGARVPALTAALSNGTMGHALNFDDTDLGSITHPASSVVLGALAAAEQVNASGKAFLLAIIAGYQVTVPLARAAGASHRDAGFHVSGTCNAPGAAMAAAEIYGLDAEAASRAIGLAIEQACGLRQYRGDGGLAISAFHCGHSAQAGVLAAQLAQEGYPAASEVLEGRYGFFKAMCGGVEPPTSLQHNGIGVQQTSIKPHPVPHIMPGAIDAARMAFGQLFANVEDIRHIKVKTYNLVLADFDWSDPKTQAQCEVSTQYNIAVGLTFPQLVLREHFKAPYISDPRLRTLRAKVTVEESLEATAAFPREWRHEITIELKDGRSAVGKVIHPKGHPDNPMSVDELAGKFHSMADKAIGDAAAAQVVDMVRHLENAHARDLGDLLMAC